MEIIEQVILDSDKRLDEVINKARALDILCYGYTGNWRGWEVIKEDLLEFAARLHVALEKLDKGE